MGKKSTTTTIRPLPYSIVTAIEPAGIPSELGEAGQRLWQLVQSQFRVDDAGGILLLTQCCLAADRVARLKKLIDRDGELLKRPDGTIRSNPLLRDEIQARAFIARCISRLGLDLQPVQHGSGRPANRSGAM
jgi:hypothetical protein